MMTINMQYLAIIHEQGLRYCMEKYPDFYNLYINPPFPRKRGVRFYAAENNFESNFFRMPLKARDRMQVIRKHMIYRLTV